MLAQWHVLEFWNTLSSAAMLPVAAGVAHMVLALGHFRFRPQALFLVFGLAGVGAGSVYFHARLSTLGQILDEVHKSFGVERGEGNTSTPATPCAAMLDKSAAWHTAMHIKD